eukprot:6294834-Amphidinium_carterae.1
MAIVKVTYLKQTWHVMLPVIYFGKLRPPKNRTIHDTTIPFDSYINPIKTVEMVSRIGAGDIKIGNNSGNPFGMFLFFRVGNGVRGDGMYVGSAI